jgi:arginase
LELEQGSDLGIDAIEIAAINRNSDYFSQFEFEDGKRTTKASTIK